jgi:hypothetical protein
MTNGVLYTFLQDNASRSVDCAIYNYCGVELLIFLSFGRVITVNRWSVASCSLGLCHGMWAVPNPFVTSGSCMSHLQLLQVRWDTSIPLLLHAAIYLEVSLLRGTSQNAFSRETSECK